MCCCGKPTINGEPGYKWQPNDAPSVRPADPPDMQDGDILMCDLPGRCAPGMGDSHSYHYRVVKRGSFFSLLVRHGAEDREISLLSAGRPIVDALSRLPAIDCYWLLNAVYHVQSEAKRKAEAEQSQRWVSAAIEKRIKVHRRGNTIRVEVQPKMVRVTVPHVYEQKAIGTPITYEPE